MTAGPVTASTNAQWLRDAQHDRVLRVLITRPADSAQEAAELVESVGGEAIVCPCLFPEPPADAAALVSALLQPPRPTAVAFTSRYAVRALASALAQLSPPLPATQALAGVCVAAVGLRTAETLAEIGRAADLISAGDGPDAPESSAAGLATQLIAHLAGSAAASVLFLRATEARPTLTAALRQAGLHVIEVEAYRMRPATERELEPLASALRAGRIDLAPFASPRSVATALSVLGPNPAALFSSVRVGAIGETTAAALRRAGLRVDVTARSPSFIQLLSDLAARPR